MGGTADKPSSAPRSSTNTNRESVGAFANASREATIEVAPANSELSRKRRRERGCESLMVTSTAHEFGGRQEQRQRLRAALGTRDRGRRFAAQRGAQQLRRELARVAPVADPLRY